MAPCAHTRGGTKIREELADALRHADLDTLFQRFCGAAPPVTPALLTHLPGLDHVRRCAIAARDASGRGVAIARMLRSAGAVPEFDTGSTVEW